MSTAPHTSGGARPPASVSAASPQPRNASGRPAGTWGTVLLPIADDESIDYTALGEEVEALGESGVDGVYTNGSAGEFYAQSEQEFDQIHNLVARICHACGLSFQIGVSHTGAQTTLDRIARAKDLGPTAFQTPAAEQKADGFLPEAVVVGRMGFGHGGCLFWILCTLPVH